MQDAPDAQTPDRTVVTTEDERKGETIAAPELRADSEPDVLLDVPSLEVEEISLEVDELRARVSLHAAVASLVALDVGADVQVEHVKLDIKGVEAQALLKVHLDRVYAIIERSLRTIDENPDLLAHLLRPVLDTIQVTTPELGRRLGKVVDSVGETVGKTVQGAVGQIGGEGAASQEAGASSAPRPAAEEAAEDIATPAPAEASAGSEVAEHLLPFDGSEESFRQWKLVGDGAADREDGELSIRAGSELGLFYFCGQRLEDFTLRMQYRLEPGSLAGLALRFRDPERPVPDRADPDRSYRYDNPAYVAVHTGFEVNLGSERPGVEPGTMNGILLGDAAGAQAHEERAEIRPDEWNELEIDVRGDRYRVTLNGKRTARFVNVDSYRGRPASADGASGFVGLVLRRGGMRLRRVEVRDRRGEAATFLPTGEGQVLAEGEYGA